MKLQSNQHKRLRTFYTDHGETTPISADDADNFFRAMASRRTLWADRRPLPTAEQESALGHLRERLTETLFPAPTTMELANLTSHPDFPAEAIARLLELLNHQC
jgi:hypothetical protein